jgi:hypothetical protein
LAAGASRRGCSAPAEPDIIVTTRQAFARTTSALVTVANLPGNFWGLDINLAMVCILAKGFCAITS